MILTSILSLNSGSKLNVEIDKTEASGGLILSSKAVYGGDDEVSEADGEDAEGTENDFEEGGELGQDQGFEGLREDKEQDFALDLQLSADSCPPSAIFVYFAAFFFANWKFWYAGSVWREKRDYQTQASMGHREMTCR